MLFLLSLITSLSMAPASELALSIENLPEQILERTIGIETSESGDLVTQNSPIPNATGNPLAPPNILLGGTAIGIVTIAILLLLAFWAYTRVYQITPNNEAFVRTGGFTAKKNMVFLYGGCVVLPGFHELTRVPMREISIDVERTGNLAVRTQDYLRANMRVTFYVCVNADEQDVKTAAARLSKAGKISPSDMKEALEKRADDAIRAAAKRKSLAEIDSDKLGFADEVLNLIQQDLKKVGLTLNNIAISEIEESDTYDTNNFFDAQGVKLRTETIQKSIKQKEEVELRTEQERREFALTTQVTIERRELEARQQSLDIEKDRESSQLAQQLELEALRAQRAREIQAAKDLEAANEQRNKILQAKAVEEEEIRKKLGVEQSQIEANIALEEQQKKLKVAQALQQQEAEIAEIARQQSLEEKEIQKQLSTQQSQIDADITLEEQQKNLKVAQALQKQEAEMAEIERQKTIGANRLKAQVEIAEAEQMSQVAKQEAAIAIAQKQRERLEAEAERAAAESAVETAKEIEQANRQKQLSAIEAEREAEKQRIGDQNVVEIDVFRRRRQAEIARQAADLEAESIRTLAEANRDKDLAEAAGIEAKFVAENAISDFNRTAQLIADLGPQFIEKLPELMTALAPQPGVLGETKIYAFPGANGSNGASGNGAGDISKLMLSTSGLTLVNALLEDGQLLKLLTQAIQLLRDSGGQIPESLEKLAETTGLEQPPETSELEES